MGKKRFKPEAIVAKLRQVGVLQRRDNTVVDAIRQIGVTEVTYYRWRREYGGMKTDQLRAASLNCEDAERDACGMDQPKLG